MSDSKSEPWMPEELAPPSGDPAADLRNAPTMAYYLSSISWAARGVVVSVGAMLAFRVVAPELDKHVTALLWAAAGVGLGVAAFCGKWAQLRRKEERKVKAAALRGVYEDHERKLASAVADKEAEHFADLIARWSPRESVAIYTCHAPQVTSDRAVTMFLRAVNYSPFDVLLHSPQFRPYAGDTPPLTESTEPARVHLGANGGTAELRVTAILPGHVQAARDSFVGLHLNGSVVVERERDKVSEKVGVLAERGGDWVKWVRVT